MTAIVNKERKFLFQGVLTSFNNSEKRINLETTSFTDVSTYLKGSDFIYF